MEIQLLIGRKNYCLLMIMEELSMLMLEMLVVIQEYIFLIQLQIRREQAGS